MNNLRSADVGSDHLHEKPEANAFGPLERTEDVRLRGGWALLHHVSALVQHGVSEFDQFVEASVAGRNPLTARLLPMHGQYRSSDRG